ncbi:hypothetical protein GCM10025858_33320 [Alicyclobacillus sacchari]|nr:hypothetical protein GCM10025858_33320 [Alicyclobacillus sacchari]
MNDTLSIEYDGLSYVIARGLLQIGAVELRPSQPFTWSSGWKSPIYCDNRLILGYPVLRNAVATGFEAIIDNELPAVELIAGAATGVSRTPPCWRIGSGCHARMCDPKPRRTVAVSKSKGMRGQG